MRQAASASAEESVVTGSAPETSFSRSRLMRTADRAAPSRSLSASSTDPALGAAFVHPGGLHRQVVPLREVCRSVRRRLVFGERGIELASHLQQMRANRMETMVAGQRLLEWLKERESGLRALEHG